MIPNVMTQDPSAGQPMGFPQALLDALAPKTEPDELPKIELTQEEADAFGNLLQRKIMAASSDIDALLERWNMASQIYYADPGAVAQNVVEGITGYPVSLWRSKCDQLVGILNDSIASAYPIVQAIDNTSEGVNEELLEQALTDIAERCGFLRDLPLAIHTAANTNIGVMRVRPVLGPMGDVRTLESDWFRPRDTCFYPTAFERIDQFDTVGHRTYKLLSEITELQDEEIYLPAVITGQDDPNQYNDLGGSVDQEVPATTIDAEDGYVELWEVITKRKVEGKMRRVIVTLAFRDRKILSIAPYDYSRPWYEVVRLCRTEKRVYTQDSVANSVQGYCLAAQDILNFIVVGAMMTAVPIVWMRGYVGPANIAKYSAGDIFPLGPEGEAGVLGMPFDATKFQIALETFMQLVDSTVGISRLMSSANLSPETKATAINAITAGDERRQSAYLNAVSESVEGVFGLFLEYLRHHLPELQQAYGGAVAELTPEILDKDYRLEVTGKSGASNPAVLIPKGQMLLEMANNPMSGLDLQKVETYNLNLMDLPTNPKALEKDFLSQIKDIAIQLANAGQDPMQVMMMGAEAMNAKMEEQNAMGALGQIIGDGRVEGGDGRPTQKERDANGGTTPSKARKPRPKKGSN